MTMFLMKQSSHHHVFTAYSPLTDCKCVVKQPLGHIIIPKYYCSGQRLHALLQLSGIYLGNDTFGFVMWCGT